MSEYGDHDDSVFNAMASFGMLMNAMGGGGDRGQMFPASDADDMSHGARFIPGEVTLDRRAGKLVQFARNCSPCCWYWQREDGTRIYHYEPLTYAEIGRANHGDGWSPDESDEPAGPCPRCGNTHTSGGTVGPDGSTSR